MEVVTFKTKKTFQMNMNSGFAVLEGVAMRQAAKHNSQYNYILMYSSAATVICPFIAAAAVQDNSDGTSGM